MAGYLTTHVLDTALGRPAAGIEVALCRIAGETAEEIARSTTNADGRTDAPLLSEADFATGTYELRFDAGAYLRECGAAGPGFLDIVPIRFEMVQDAHYHVPLLLSPYGYSTYRGS